MPWFVTGGSGFLGKRLIATLHRRGDLDSLPDLGTCDVVVRARRWPSLIRVDETQPIAKQPLGRAVIAHEMTVDDTKARREFGDVGATTIEAGLAAMRSTSAAALKTTAT